MCVVCVACVVCVCVCAALDGKELNSDLKSSNTLSLLEDPDAEAQDSSKKKVSCARGVCVCVCSSAPHFTMFQILDDDVTEISEVTEITDATDVSEASDLEIKKKVRVLLD